MTKRNVERADVPESVRRRLTIALAVAAIASSLSACETYLHSDAREAIATKTQADAGKIDISAKFAEMQTRLAELATKEDEAVAALNIAQRNNLAMDIIRPLPAKPGEGPIELDVEDMPVLSGKVVCLAESSGASETALASKHSARDRLTCVLRDDLNKLIGRAAAESADKNAHKRGEPAGDSLLNKLAAMPNTVRVDAALVAAAKTNYKTNLADYLQTRPAGDSSSTKCADLLKEGIRPVTDKVSEIRNRLVQACSGMEAPDPFEGINVGGRMGDAIRDYRAAALRKKEQLRKAEELKEELKKLALPEAPDSVAEDLKAKIEKLRRILSEAEGIAALVGWTEVGCTLDNLLTKELVPPDDAAAAAGEPPAGEKAKPAADGCELVSGNEPPTAEDEHVGAKFVALALGIASAVDTYHQQTAFEHINSLLVARAQVTHLINVASLHADLEADRMSLANQKAFALARQLYHTRRAMTYARRIPNGPSFDVMLAGKSAAKHEAVGLALSEWVAGQNEGYVPWRVLRLKEYQIDRAFTVKLAKTTDEDFKRLMKPVLDDLEAYGKGGIRPETIARLLTDLGLIAAVGSD